jgi:acetylglutamate kinase
MALFIDPLRRAPYDHPSMSKAKIPPMAAIAARTEVLVEALPYIRRFRGATLVIKYGGAAMVEEALKSAVCTDLVLMEHVGMRPIVVHGGGPEISKTAERLGVASKFVEGQRVTDAEMLWVAEMVLSGNILRQIVVGIQQAGGRAAGVTGKDNRLITASKLEPPPLSDGSRAPDMGFVGEVASVNPEILQILQERGIIPVVSPIGPDESGQAYNINADSVASALATTLRADKLILLTDTPGVCRDAEDRSTLMRRIGAGEVESLITDGVISGGMIPKVRGAVAALGAGVGRVHIIDGRVEHSLLLELFTDEGIGTMIHRDDDRP